jgi:hypothetical protein
MVGECIAIGRDDDGRAGTESRIEWIVRPPILASATDTDDGGSGCFCRFDNKPRIRVKSRSLARTEIVKAVVVSLCARAVGTQKCEFHKRFLQ